MDPSVPMQVPDNSPSFCKPLDAANRKYHRHTPIHGSDSSSGDSPKHRGHSPVFVEDKKRKDDRRESENDYAKNGDHSRHHKHADEEDRGYHRSSRPVRESRIGTDSDYSRHNNNSDRSREIWQSRDKYSRDKSESAARRCKDKDYKYRDRDSDKPREFQDERRDRHRSPDNYKNDRISSREEPRAHGKDSTLRRESVSSRSKDALLSGEVEARVSTKGPQEQSALKKLKHYDSEDGNPSSSSKHVKEISEATQDLNAANVAAIKAAEVGSSYLSTDQKKKLLRGNKKNTCTEEQQAGDRWDFQLFADRERQEKFNKLMGVKGDAIPERKPTEMKEKLEMELEKQYTAGLRRRDGRTVGLGL